MAGGVLYSSRKAGQLSEQEKANMVRLSEVEESPDITISASKLATIIGKTAIDVLPRRWHVLPDERATHSVLAAEVLKRLD